MRVFTYCRVSTDTQVKTGDSLQDQTDALRKWADEHGCTIIGEYVDAGFSGAKSYHTRPQFCKMLEDADRLHPDVLLFTRLDRFTRNPRDYFNVAHIFEEHGLQWKTIWQDFDTTTAAGRAMIGTMVVFSELERNNVSDRIKAHNAEKRSRGELTSGKMPRGYITVNKKPVKDPAKEEAMNAFWTTYVSGKNLHEAVDAANALGAGIASYASANAIAKNAMAYTGTIQGISCEPYITVEDAEVVLSRRKHYERQQKHQTIFTRICKCGSCGRLLSVHATGRTKTYYNCNAHYRMIGVCDNGANVSENDIEKFLLTNLDNILRDRNMRIKTESRDAKRTEAEKKIKKLESKKQRLLDAYMDALISKDTFSLRLKAIDDEIESLSVEPIKEDKIIVMPESWKEMYAQLNADSKHEFWLRTLNHVTIRKDRSIEVSFR